MKEKIAVVCAPGIGDGLILHVASHNLVQMGYEVTTFNDHLEGFGKWLHGYRFAKQPELEKIEEILSHFDAVILQHDNTPKSKKVREWRGKVFGFLGSHRISKHGALSDLDYVCDPSRTMVDNIARATARWFGAATKENGLTSPAGLVHRKNLRRIAIHSTSGAAEKNWPQEKFTIVAEKLKKEGYNPVFIANRGKPLFPTLEELASFLYESGSFLGNDSGPGHIASCLKIPSLVIGKEEKQMRLWAPGWLAPEIAVPPRWSSQWRWARAKWKYFITTRNVIKKLKEKVLKN